MRALAVFAFFTMSLWMACQSNTQESTAPSIETLESSYAADPSEENLTALLLAYKADSTGKYLASAAHLELERQQFEEGINTLKTLLKKQLSSETVLQLAKAYEDQQKLTIASIIYKAYRKAYPQDAQNQQLAQRLLGDMLPLETQMQQIFKDTYIDSLNRMDLRVANQYITSSEAYALILPQSDSAVIHLRQAAEIANSLGDAKKAIEIQNWIIEQYSDTNDAKTALFMSAFIYENSLGEIEEAKKRYEKYLELYPNGSFADDAKISLQYLGQDPSVVLDKIQNKAKN